MSWVNGKRIDDDFAEAKKETRRTLCSWQEHVDGKTGESRFLIFSGRHGDNPEALIGTAINATFAAIIVDALNEVLGLAISKKEAGL